MVLSILNIIILSIIVLKYLLRHSIDLKCLLFLMRLSASEFKVHITQKCLQLLLLVFLAFEVDWILIKYIGMVFNILLNLFSVQYNLKCLFLLFLLFDVVFGFLNSNLFELVNIAVSAIIPLNTSFINYDYQKVSAYTCILNMESLKFLDQSGVLKINTILMSQTAVLILAPGIKIAININS